MAETGGVPAEARPIETRNGNEQPTSREQVVKAFTTGSSFVEKTLGKIPEENRTPEQKHLLLTIKGAKEKTLDQGKDSITNTFGDIFEDKRSFTQQDGIPVEGMITLITKELAESALSNDERKDLAQTLRILKRNSKSYSDPSNPLGAHRMDAPQFVARIRQEANLISKDPRATPGDPVADWHLATATMNARQELILPPATTDTKDNQPPTLAKTPADTPSTDQPVRALAIPDNAPRDLVPAPTSGPDGQPPPPPPSPDGDQPPTPDPAPQQDQDGTTPQPAPTPHTPSTPDVVREFAIINRSLDIRKRASEMAEKAIREEQRRGSAFNPLNWSRKVRMRVLEHYYRQQYTERAVAEMRNNNNAYLSMDVVRNAAVNATNRATDERESGLAKAEQVKANLGLAGEDVREAQGQIKTLLMNDIIKPIVEGRISSQAQVQDALRTFVQTHQNEQDIKDLFGNDATQYGRLADYFASDLLETGQMVKDDIAAHKYAIDQLDQVVKIKLANTSWAAETQANFNWVDRTIANLQSRRSTAWLGNPAFVGAAASLITFGTSRALGASAKTANVVAPGVGLLLGGGFAALRRNMDLKRDMATHRAEMAYGSEIPTDADRRERLQRRAYEVATVDEIINGTQRIDSNGNSYDRPAVGGDARGVRELMGLDLTNGNNQDALVRRIAEMKTRLNFSATNKVDLLTFSGREQVEQGRLELVKAIVEARQALRSAGMADIILTARENHWTGSWNQRFIQDKTQQDRAFLIDRVGSSMQAFGTAVLFGSIGGAVTQEGLAVTGRVLDIPANAPLVGGLFGRGTTQLEHGVNTMANMFGQADVFADRSAKTFLGVDLDDAFSHPRDFGIGGNKWLAFHPDTIDGGRAFTVVAKDAAGNVISTEPGPPMWVQGGHDGEPARLIIAGTADNLPPTLKTLLSSKEHHLTDEHNMFSYMKKLAAGGPANTADEVLGEQKFKGNFLTNTHDIVESKIHGVGDPNKTYDQLASDAKWIDPATGKVEVGKMSITGPNGMQFNGFIRSDGTFDMDTNHYGNADFLKNPAELAKTIQQFKTEGWGVVQDAKTPSLYHITPPVATEYIMGADEAPIIVTPFAPRHPLEELLPKDIIDKPPKKPRKENPYGPDYYGEGLFPKGSRAIDIFQRKENESSSIAVDTTEGQAAIAEAHRLFDRSDHVYVVLGGAIGDAVISTAYVKGVEEGLKKRGKTTTPITVIVNQDHGELYDSLVSGTINIMKVPRGRGLEEAKATIATKPEIGPLVLDFEHYRDKNPTVRTEKVAHRDMGVIDNLLAPGIELYNNDSDQDSRYSHYIEDVFSLPKDSLDKNKVKPSIQLPSNKDAIYDAMATKFNIDKTKPQVAVVIETKISGKRYKMDHWAKVISEMSKQKPGYQYNIIYNPSSTEKGYTKADIEAALTAAGIVADGTPTASARLVSGSLMENAVLMENQDLVLSNDTGLAHIAAAIETGPPVVTVFMPKHFSPNFWVSNKKQKAVALPQDQADALADVDVNSTDEDEKLINKVSPDEVVRVAINTLNGTP